MLFKLSWKLHRDIKSGTRAIYWLFSPTVVLRVSGASLSLASLPYWRAIPVTFCHSSVAYGPNVTPVDSACASAW